MNFWVSTRVREEFNDFDYIHKLQFEDRDWLRRFQREYLNADFQHSGEQIHPDELKKDCYNMNNSRNRDLYAITRAQNKLLFVEHYGKITEESNIPIAIKLLHLDKEDIDLDIIEDFRNNKPEIIRYVEKNGIKDIGSFAATGAVSLYAIWTFIGEEFPEYAEDVKKNKKALRDFYGYK